MQIVCSNVALIRTLLSFRHFLVDEEKKKREGANSQWRGGTKKDEKACPGLKIYCFDSLVRK